MSIVLGAERLGVDNVQTLESIGVNVFDVFHRFCNNEALVYKFMKKFTTDDNYNRLKEAVIMNNLQQIEMRAHTIKGMCANLGLNALMSDADAIVYAVRHQEFDKIEKLFDRFESEYAKVCTALSLLN